MKRTICTLILLVTGFLCFSQEVKPSEISIYNEINSFITAGYYPGVIDQAELLEKEYPESVFLLTSLCSKGEALLNMNRIEDAQKELGRVYDLMLPSDSEYERCCNLYGKALYRASEKEAALGVFYKGLAESKKELKSEYYNSSVYYTGKIFYDLENFKNAVRPYEYIFYNGGSYEYEEYSESVQKLFISCNKSGSFEKTIDFFNQLDLNQFDGSAASLLTLYAGEAYENTGDYIVGYNLYCSLIENPDTNVAVTAMQKAYGVAHSQNLDVNPEDVFVKLEENHSDIQVILNEFWARLGIDYYNKKDFEKCRECFASIQEPASQVAAVCGIYNSKMMLDEGVTPGEVENYLLQFEKSAQENQIIKLADAYYAQLMQCKILMEEWNAAKSFYEKIEQKDIPAYYSGAVINFKLKNYDEAIKIAETNVSGADYDLKVLELRAACYAGKKNFKKSETIYKLMADQGIIDGKNRIEYAKVLLSLKKYDKAISQAVAAKQPLSEYIAGIASYNMANWSDAEIYLNSFLNKNKKSEYEGSAYFYKAYAVYKQGKYADSYSQFAKIEDYTDNHKMLMSAFELGATSAVIKGELKKGIVLAEKMIEKSSDGEEKNHSILFCADIYLDDKNYKKAESLLLPCIEEHSDFGMQAMFRLANVYVQSKELAKAEEIYAKICTDYEENPKAEDAAYSSAEIYFTAQIYKQAGTNFAKYIKKYPKGRYIQGAYYYYGECAFRCGEYNNSILQNKLLLSKYPKSIYAYGAYSNLLQIYYNIESYGEALEVAKTLLRDYKDQAVSDGIEVKITELSKITEGVDRALAEKISDYEAAGKDSTVEGRIAGTDLVQLYSNSGSVAEAVALAEKLLPLQTEDEEIQYAAKNADFCAEYYYKSGEQLKAASLWLKAAEYYRSAGDTVKAPQVLYSAADCFMTNGKRGDAEVTAGLLVKLYPESIQAKSVDSLLE